MHNAMLLLDIMHRHTPETALIGLSTIVGDYITTQWFQRTQTAALLQTIEAVSTTANVYLRATPLARKPTNGQRGAEKDSIGTSVLWADLDCYDNKPAALEAIAQLPHKPTMLVDSGHGYHLYWLLNAFATDLHAIKARNKALQLQLVVANADSVYDLARIMRVPGTQNLKNGNPVPCTVLEYNPECVYALEDFDVAPIDDDKPIAVWDHTPLPVDFLDQIRDADKNLYKRMVNETLALKAEASLTKAGAFDYSRNDAWIATRLLSLGFSPTCVCGALINPDLLCGQKYARELRYNYVLSTLNSALRTVTASPDRYFIKSAFLVDKLGTELNTASKFVYTASQLWRYVNGVYVADAVEYIRAECVKKLGAKWSMKAADSAVQWIVDQSQINVDTINKHDGLINVRNGMLDFKTRQLLPHSPDYLSFAQLPVLYDANADSSAIDQFLAQVLPVDTVDVFWEYVGSIFVRNHYWPKAFLSIVGPKDCGKSKVLEWAINFLGGKVNVTSRSFVSLADDRFAAAELFGKLANIKDDLSSREAQDCSKIKELTGDTTATTGEHKFKAPFTFKNLARFIFTSNAHLAVRNPDDAYFARAIIIECSRVFLPHEQDLEIVDKLSTPQNLSGGLLRVLSGLERLQKQRGFSQSASIAVASANYRFASDTVMAFLRDCTEDSEYKISRQQMYTTYRQMCEANKRSPVSADLFFKRVNEHLQEFGMRVEHSTQANGDRVWVYVGRRPLTQTVTVTFNAQERLN